MTQTADTPTSAARLAIREPGALPPERDRLRQLALHGVEDSLQTREPDQALRFLQCAAALTPDPEPAAPASEESLAQTAEALFRFAAELAFTLLHAPETAPAVFEAEVAAWRAAHLPAPEDETLDLTGPIRAALARYLELCPEG